MEIALGIKNNYVFPPQSRIEYRYLKKKKT